jgi:hypothetical protein
MNDYLSEVYDWITKQDNSFSGDVDIESFKQKMQDDSYAKEIHGWMSSIDNSFSADVPEPDFLAKVKKKDSSALQGAVSPEDTQDIASVSEGGQPSLVQLSQDSLDERFSGYKDLPVDEQISLIKQEEKRPFYEAQGVDYNQFLSSQKAKEQYDLDTSKKSRGGSRDEFEVGKYLVQTEDDAFEAEGKYNKAKYEQALANYSPDQLEEQLEKENIDLGYIPTEFIKVNGESTSIKGLERKLYDQDFIDDLQAGKASIDIDNPHNTESLEYLSNLATRQEESGGQWGDLAESFYAGALDLLVAGPLEFLEGIGASTNPYQQAMYMTHGGEFSNKIHKYANKVREKTRVYSEDAITKSLLKGNFSNAMFQTGNALAESAPLILSMYAAAPLKLGQFATLGFAGASAGGIQSLELKEQRLKGEIDISDGMLLLNATLTGAAEAVFERYTLDAVNAGRGLLKMGKMKAPEIAKKFVEGFGKSLFIEGGSEAGTELSNTFTNILTGAEEYTGIEDIAVRLSDAALIGAIMGGGMHTTSHLAKSMTDARHKMLNENISVLFTLADGSTKEMSRAEALKFVKDPEVASQVRDNTISMDASINSEGKRVLEDIVYGFHAPDAVAAREVMSDKENAVQSLADRVEASKEITPEDVNGLADAMAEMEAEGKVNEYNVTDRTVATRKRVTKLLKDKGVELVDAVQQQDTSMSEVTETTDADKIDSKEQYRSIKKQIKDGKKKPIFVKSQNQPGVKIEGESVQTSEVTQGRFKSVSAAKNAMKEFELKQKAAKDGKLVSDEAFPINNKEFINTKKETLDEIPKEVLDKNEYHIISPSKKGLNAQEKVSRMDKLKSALDDAGAEYYTVKGVYNGVIEESLVVTGINNAQALSLGRNLGQESVFSSKDGLMFGNGSVAPLTGDMVKGPEARRRGSLTIMNVGGKKVSMHTGVDRANMSYGKNFNSDNIHRLDESDPNYDSELFEGVPEDRKRALGFAFKLLSSIGGLNVNIVRNSEAMAGQMKQLGQNSDSIAKNKRASFFRAADKTIYVNLETVQGNTLFHEIIHPMVDFIKKTDPALYSKIEKEVAESNVKRRVTKDGRRLKGSYMEWVKAQPTYANLSKEAQIEEAFAEMMGDAAYGHFVNRQSTLGRLRELMKEILKKITPLKFDNPESVSLDDLSLTDIRKNLAGALVNGRSITVGGVEFEVGDMKGTTEDRLQVDAIDEKTQVQYKYDQNSEVFAQMEDEGIISSGKTMQDFKGKTMMVHSPDAMFSGTIIDRDGTILVEGKGGVLYTLKFNEEGYFWASTDNAANKMVDQLNSMLEANGGKIYMALTTAPQDKLLSNTAANRGLVNLLTSQNFISKIKLNKAGVYKALIEAANFKKEVVVEDKKGKKVKKTIGLGLGIGAFRASSKFQDDVLQKVWDKLGNENSSFKDRKLFSDQLLKSIKAQKFGAFQAADSKANFVNFIKTTAGDKSMVDFSKSGAGNIQSIKKALINVLTEPSLREEDATNKVYAVLEIDGPVKAVKTDSYESYGTSIVSAEGNRAKIHRIDNRENWYDFAKDPETGEVVGNKIIGRSKDGKPVYRRSQLFPEMAGVSMQPLKFQAPALFNEPNPEAGDVARVYMIDNSEEFGIDPNAEVAAVSQLDDENSKMIADAYEAIVDNPKDPEVKEAYEALADETLRQYESILDRGYEVEIWRGEGEPYANSTEMIQDARDNKHMYIFGTEAGFGEGAITPKQREDNAMLAETQYADLNGEPLLVNDVFRFVHDFFGHTELGNGFGPVGEENAWLSHSRMYSPTARKAMTTETRGQNSWVNYNKNLRRGDGSIPNRGDEDYVPLPERPFAEQKMGILPNEIIYPTDLKYQVPTDGETNVYTSGLATIAWDISKAILDTDYKAGRYLTKYIDKKQQYDIRLTTLLAKPFGTHSNKEVKEIMVRSKGNLNVELLRVSEASNKLKKAMKGSNLSRSEVNDLLHNLNEVKAMEASALKEALIEMRTHIDYLSKTLVSEGLVKGQTQFTIDSNLGVYVTRSYKQFDVKGWTQTDNDIIKNAKDFLYREAKKDNPEATEGSLQEIVKVAYRDLTEDKEFFKSSNGATSLDGLTRVNSIFKEKKIIPEEIRDLWGEIDNPLYNYSNTISKVARTISAERMYRELYEIGQGKFISDTKGSETHNKLVGSKWGSLEGKFVDEEMFAVMNQTVKNLEGNLWYDSYMRLVLFNKKMKTVWNPGTHAKNIIGNTSFAIMNGHIGFNGGMYEDAKTSIKAIRSLKSPELKALYSKLVALGVVNSSASLQEIRGIAEDINDTKFDLSEYLDEKSGKIQKLMAKAVRATGKPIKYLDKKAMQAYQAEDDVWKIFGYLSEKARYVKAGMDAKAAEELAAKNIRNLYPNYNEIPRIIRYLGRSPLVGSFVAFQAESIRNAKNTVLLGFEELGSSNPEMRKIGAQRIGGTLATMTVLEGLQLYTAQFLGEALGFGGEDDEEVEERKMRLLLPEWDAAGNIAYMFKGKLDSRQAKDKQTEGDRYFDYINFSSISGVGYAKDIIRLSFYDLDTQIGKESAMNTLKKIYAPFLGQEMTLKVMIDALGNKGGKVYNPSENGIKQAIDIVTFVGEQVKPGAVKSGLRLKESMYDLDSELVPGYEALALFGLRISRVNVNKGLGIKSNFIYKDMINTVDKSILRDRAALLKEAEENPQFDEYLNQMADLIGAARLNSVSGEDIKAILYNSRVSKPVIEEAHLRYLNKYLEDVIRVDSK